MLKKEWISLKPGNIIVRFVNEFKQWTRFTDFIAREKFCYKFLTLILKNIFRFRSNTNGVANADFAYFQRNVVKKVQTSLLALFENLGKMNEVDWQGINIGTYLV